MFTRILAKTGILTTLCMYPSVEALSETCLSLSLSLTLSHSLSLCTRALQCKCVRQRLSTENRARVPKHVQMINFTLWWLNLSVNPLITCLPNCGDWSVRITDHLRSIAPLTKTIHCVVFVINRLDSVKPLVISDMLDG